MRLIRTVTCFSWLLSASPVTFVSAQTATPTAVSLLIRTDDIGMSHSVNMAMQKLVSTGMPVSVSVLFVCPWYQEAVEILKQHPNVSVGIHLALNSEWKNYRWGPVVGSAAVPSLVDENGFFFPSSEALHQHNPNVAEVEKELRAQIERALRSGVKIDYVDEHMGTATRYPEFREVTIPAVERGLEKSGRTRSDFQISCPVFVITGTTEEEISAADRGTREQVAFYASTPNYRGVLDLHGWGELQGELNVLSKQGRWSEMAELIDDAMVDAFAVRGRPADIAERFLQRYGDVVDRVSLYTGEATPQMIGALRGERV